MSRREKLSPIAKIGKNSITRTKGDFQSYGIYRGIMPLWKKIHLTMHSERGTIWQGVEICGIESLFLGRFVLLFEEQFQCRRHRRSFGPRSFAVEAQACVVNGFGGCRAESTYLYVSLFEVGEIF